MRIALLLGLLVLAGAPAAAQTSTIVVPAGVETVVPARGAGNPRGGIRQPKRPRPPRLAPTQPIAAPPSQPNAWVLAPAAAAVAAGLTAALLGGGGSSNSGAVAAPARTTR
jgi:hypothetical protein